jgi:hypothetical protein
MEKQYLKRLSRVLAVSICVLIIASGASSLVPAIAGTVSGNAGQSSFVLTPPPFIEIASAEVPPGTGTAFHADEAGFCSWVNSGQTIDLEKAVLGYSQILELTSTHALGIVPVSNWRATINLYVYVDTTGYLVAYFDYNYPASRAISWSGQNFNDPSVTFLTDRAIEILCGHAGISYGTIAGDIQYYDFNYPDAQSMLVFENTNKDGTDDYTTLLIPVTYSLYEAGYSLVNDGKYSNYYSRLFVDGVQIDNTGSLSVSRYDLSTHLPQSESHTIRTLIVGTGGSATVLLYTVG